MYLVLLIVGAGFIVLSLVLGEALPFEGVGGAFFRPIVIAVTLTVTGGVGLILAPMWGSYLAFPFAAAAGLFAGFLLYRFVILPLQRIEHTSSHDKQALIGSTAKVVLGIPQGGFGKIKYNVTGAFVTSPAKSEDGIEIKKDTEVVIAYIKNNAYYVRERSAGITAPMEMPNTN
ncbi:MAG: hypothetical protein FWC73_05475 [Defluviitaleaceae bacterium]|nr:hypothetical protein [Defluviitaleaceae bacterium]